MKLKEHGIYIIKDIFFTKFYDKNLNDNKGTGRPFYYIFKDKINSDIFWLIPMTTQIEKAQKKIEQLGGNPKKCLFYEINFLQKNSVFNIGNIFPITEKYLEREYIDKLSKKHLIINNSSLNNEIKRKALKIIRINTQTKNPFSLDIKLLKEKLLADLELDKFTLNKYISKNTIPYSPLTGLKFENFPIDKFKEINAWLEEEFVKKHSDNIKIKAEERPITFFSTELNKNIILYNVEQLIIDKSISCNFKKFNEKNFDFKIENLDRLEDNDSWKNKLNKIKENDFER